MIILGVTFTEDGLSERSHFSDLPKRSKNKPGDWVQLHAYPSTGGWKRWGFRGFILGSYGGDLFGLTDEGREWVESPSILVRDGQPNPSAVRCVCCARPPRRPKKAPKGLEAFGPAPECLRPYLPAEPVKPVQLDLFEVAA